MFKLFSQPYPIEDSPGRNLRKAVIIGLFVGVFLVVFQPFGLSTWNTSSKLIKLFGFGLITFIVTSFNFIVWPRLFPDQFSDQRWTVGREIGLVMGNILLIAIANRLYLEWILAGVDSGMGWVGMILVTFLIGLFPTTGAVLLSYIQQLKKYSQSAAQLTILSPDSSNRYSENNSHGQSGTVAADTLLLVADNEKDALSLQPTDLLFIESSDNYCTVVYLKNQQPAKPLLRSSLSRLESQIALPHIVRCHRSYVVNLHRVERVTGNAQGYKLHLLGGHYQVPVARKYNDTLVAELKAL